MTQQEERSMTTAYSDRDLARIENAVLSRNQMHQYQHVGREFIISRPFCGLFIDMGMGKTVTTLSAISELWVEGAIKKVLVIAPLKVANQVWPAEIRNWHHLCLLRHSLATGDATKRIAALRSDAPIHIINRENIDWLVEYYGKNWPYDMVVIDESSSFKDHKSSRFKALRRVRPRIKRLVELTASPVAEGYHGLFSQIFLLDEGERFGRFITHFEQNYFTFNSFSRKHTIRPDAKQQIIDKISDITLEMKAADYLTTVGFQDVIKLVELSKAEQARYRQMATEFTIDVINSVGEGHVIEAESAGVLATKLLQMASGVIYRSWREIKPGTEDTVILKKEVIHLHDHKMDALDALLEELDGEPALIVYWFKSTLERLQKKYPKLVTLDKEASQVPLWDKGKIQMLAIHPQSAGHGLNLQKGGRNMIFFDMPQSLELYEQIRCRIDRQGQKHLCRFFHLIAKGTDDEKVMRRLTEKKQIQDWFFARLKRAHLKIKTQIAEKLKWLS